MTEDVEDDIYELPDSGFVKYAAIIFDKLDNGKDGILPPPKFVDFIATLGEDFHSVDLAGHLRKLDPNEIGSLDCFAFVRWYVEEEVSQNYAEEAEHLVGWACKVIMMNLQR